MKTFLSKLKKLMKDFDESMDSYGNARLIVHNSLLDTKIDFEKKHTPNPKLLTTK
jgi:hypothetical protein